MAMVMVKTVIVKIMDASCHGGGDQSNPDDSWLFAVMKEMAMWMAMVFWIGEIVAPVGGDCAVGGSSVGAQ